MIRLLKRIVGNYWVPKKCGWPYPDGYAAYNKFKNTVLDAGLTREEAKMLCQELNG